MNNRINFKVALYIRLSAEDERKQQSRTVENQRMYLLNYIQDKPWFQLYGIYEDIRETGVDFARPGFIQMMKEIEAKRVNCIIVKDLSRFGRNYIEVSDYIENKFPTQNIRFIAVDDDFDSFLYEEGKMIGVAFKNILNDAFVKDISDRIRKSRAVNYSQGRFLGNIAPYGYLRSKEDRYKLVVDEQVAALVKQIFAWKLEGWSDMHIVHYLNQMGYCPPRKHQYLLGLVHDAKSAQCRYWHKSAISRMLRNPIYTRDMVQHRYETKGISSGVKRDVTPDEWVVVPNTHKALISKDDFERIQTILAQAAVKVKDRTEKAKIKKEHENLFKGIIRCCDCGRDMARHKDVYGAEASYTYLCATYEKISRSACSKKTIKDLL